MSKPKLFTTKGHLLTNASRIRTGTPRRKPPIEPNNDPHVNGCGCLSCRIVSIADEAIERELGGESDSSRDGLAPTQGVLGNSKPKGKPGAPLMPTRGVLAGDAS